MLIGVDQSRLLRKRLLIDGLVINRVMTGDQHRIDGLSPTGNDP